MLDQEEAVCGCCAPCCSPALLTVSYVSSIGFMLLSVPVIFGSAISILIEALEPSITVPLLACGTFSAAVGAVGYIVTDEMRKEQKKAEEAQQRFLIP